MWLIDVLSRIVHVATAITLVGGSVFTLWVLLPSAKQLSDEAHETLRSAVMGRWKYFVHGGIVLFLVTGFYNYIRAMADHQDDGLYHALIGTKILLSLGVFFLAAAMVGKSPKLEPIRQSRAKWLRVLVLLAAVIVAIAGFVKVRGGVADGSEANAATAEPVETE